jgi:hypothetical protein
MSYLVSPLCHLEGVGRGVEERGDLLLVAAEECLELWDKERGQSALVSTSKPKMSSTDKRALTVSLPLSLPLLLLSTSGGNEQDLHVEGVRAQNKSPTLATARGRRSKKRHAQRSEDAAHSNAFRVCHSADL